MSRFLHELKRRRVFRVAAMYSAVAFVVWRAADIAFPALHLPAWLVTAVVALTIIGFPIALVLAWAFDITPAGVQRTQPDADVRAAADAVGSTTETRVVAVAAMIVIAIAAAAAFALRRDRGAPPDAGRVLVMTFENLAGDASLDPVGRMAAEWLTQGLAVTGIVEVIPAITVVTAVRAAGSGADLTSARQIALELGAGTVVWGTYFTSGGRLSFSAHIFDAARGRLIGSLEPVTAPLDYPAAGLVELRERVMSGLGAMLNPRLAGWPGATSQPWSWAAYQEYADGMERYVASDYFGAATHFGRSFAMDSALLVAALWQANSNANGIDIDAAFETAAWLENRRERLAPYDRAFLDRLRARLRGDLPAMHRASLRMLEIAPSADDAIREVALDALRLNRAAESLERLRALDPERGWVRGWREYWFFAATAYHQLGRHEDELRAAREGRRHDPDCSFLWDIVEASALAALGRTDDVRTLIVQAAEHERHRVPPAALFGHAAAALLAHGHDTPARELFARAAAEPAPDLGPAAQTSAQTEVRARGIQLGGALRADALLMSGDAAAAQDAYAAVLAAIDTSGFSLERRNRLSALAGLALAATLLGDHDAAARSNRRDRGDAVRQRAVARAVRAQPRRRRAPDARGVRERAAAFHESDGISGPLSRSGAAPAARAFRLPRAGAATDGGVTMKRRCASRRLAPAASCITRT